MPCNSRVRSGGGAVLLGLAAACGAGGPAATIPPDSLAARTAWLRTHAAALRTVDPDDPDDADLAAVGAAIGGAHVVLLGEQTHGDGATFSAKVRLVKYLHRRLGFDLLVIESGLYDAARIWANVRAGAPSAPEAREGLFFMYSTSRQMQPLFAYLDAERAGSRPLELAGWDSDHTAGKAWTSLVPDLEAFLRGHGSPLVGDAAWQLFGSLAVTAFHDPTFRPPVAQQDSFFERLGALEREVGALQGSDDDFLASPGFWLQVLESIRSQTERNWRMSGLAQMARRDAQMADNLLWVAQAARAGKRIVVWAHNAHVARDVAPLIGFATAGSAIGAALGQDAYVINFTGNDGAYDEFVSGTVLAIPAAPAGSLEDLLARTGYPYAFLDLRGAPAQATWLGRPLSARLLDYRSVGAVWPDHVDAFFFIATGTPAVRE